MPTREARVIALAGVFQACALVRALATRGDAARASAESSLASIFRIDAESVEDVFGGLAGVRTGLESLIAQLDGDDRDLALTQLVLNVVRVARKLSRDAGMRRTLRDGIVAIGAASREDGVAEAEIQPRLAALYCQTLSQLRPRVVVHGNPTHLGDAKNVERIRAMLLAAVRAAVLWHQVGGSQLRLLLRRREYAMLARGLLTRCTLDRG